MSFRQCFKPAKPFCGFNDQPESQHSFYIIER